jgi:hypothetical protein
MITALCLVSVLIAQLLTLGAERALSPHSALHADPGQVRQTLPQWSGADGGEAADSAVSTVVRTREDWAQLWRKLDRPMPRALEESREMGILISIGERPTGGFSPRVVSATIRRDQLVIIYNEGKPSRDAMVIQALTKPWVVAIVPKTSLPVVIEPERQRVRRVSSAIPGL